MLIRDDNITPPPEPPVTDAAPVPDDAREKAPPKPQVLGELRRDLEIFRGGHDDTGAKTWILFDPVGDTYFRISEADYRIIRLWTGNPEAGDFLEKLRRAGIHTTREHLLAFAQFLFHSNLLRASYQVTAAKAEKLRAVKRKMIWHLILSYYLFFRIPLWSPNRFLVRTHEVVEWIFNRWTLWALRLLAGVGYLCLIVNFYKFTDAFLSSINIQGMIRYSIAVVVIKIIHEFSHAYTACHYGCRVRRMGIAFIFFFPRLYTDLTDSWRIRDRSRRFLIDGAGIISEFMIGGVAALVWANTGEGLTHAVAYYIFAVSIINTVLINGNPFIRYDGYYMLMDLVNIDNLQKRGVTVIRNVWRKNLFGLPVEDDPARGFKRFFLFFYGIGMFVYRIFLYLSIILLVYFHFAKALGIVLLVLEVYLMILKPIIEEAKFVIMNRARLNWRRTAWTLAGAGLLLALLVTPLPWRIAAPCEVKSEHAVTVYAPVDGFLTQLPPTDGTAVKNGDVLFEQDNPLLTLRQREADLDIAIHRNELDRAERDAKTIGEGQVIRQALASSIDARDEMQRRAKQQRTLATGDGVFTRHDRHLVPGKYLNRGTVVGAIHAPNARNVAAFIPEDDMKFIRPGDRATVELNNTLKRYRGKVVAVREMMAVLEPSPVLDVFGGTLLTTPLDDQTFIPQAATYRVDIELDEPAPTGRSGMARIRKFSSVAGNLARTVVRVLRTELSF